VSLDDPSLIGEVHHGPAPTRLIGPRFLIVTAATFAYFICMGALVPTLPRYVEDELGGGGVAVGLVVGLFAVSAAVVRPWAGRLGDLRGRRLLITGGSLVMGVSVLAYALTDSVPPLIALRLVSGIGEAAVFVGAATAIQDLAPDDRRGEAASYFSVALYGGIAVGPLLGEWLADEHGFHAVWYAAGGSALLAALLGLGTQPHHGGPVPRPERLLHRSALGPGLVLMLGLIPFVGFGTFIELYGEDIGLDDVGPVFAAYAVSVLLIRVLGARLPDRLGWRVASTIALVSVGSGALVLAAWASVAAVWIAALGMSVGMSLLFPALFSAAVAGVPEEQRSQAVGTFSVFFDLANGIGAPVLGLVVALSSYRGAFFAAALIAACGWFAQLSLQHRTGREAAAAIAD
jgi:MFS family permease